jgi:hypothetical protein
MSTVLTQVWRNLFRIRLFGSTIGTRLEDASTLPYTREKRSGDLACTPCIAIMHTA